MSTTEADLRREQQLSSTLRMPIAYLRDTIRSRRENRTTCLQFLCYVPCVILFVFLFFSERNVETSYFAAETMRRRLVEWRVPPYSGSNYRSAAERPDPSTITPGDRLPYSPWSFADVGQELADSYTFFTDIVTPSLFPPRNESLLGTWDSLWRDLYPEKGHVGAFRPVGPLRLRAKHVRSGAGCSTNAQFAAFQDAGVPCNAKWSTDVEETSEVLGQSNFWWYYHDRGCDSALTTLEGWLQSYNCGGYIVDIPFAFGSRNNTQWFTTTQEDVWPITQAMQESRVLRSSTLRFFEIDLFVYNPTVACFVRVNLYFEVTAGGGWFSRADIRPFLTTNNNPGYLLYALVVLGMFGFSSFILLVRWIRDVRRTKTVLPFLFRDWHIIDLLNAVCYAAWFVVHLMWWTASADYDSRTGFVYPTLRWTANASAFAMDRNWTNVPAEEEIIAVPFQQRLIEISNLYWISIYLNSVNMFLLFIRFLHFLRVFDRVMVLERTLTSSARALMSVVVLLCLYVLAYSIAGTILFGPHLYEMRSIQESWTTLFRTLIGSFDYDAMNDVSVVATAAFFWTFVMFGLFVLLNFCIAILMQNFQEQSSQAASEPMHVSVNHMWERWKFYKQRRSVGEMVLDVLFFSNRDWRAMTLKLLDEIEAEKRANGEAEKLEGFFISFPQLQEAAATWRKEALRRQQVEDDAYIPRSQLERSAGTWVIVELIYTTYLTIRSMCGCAVYRTDEDDNEEEVSSGSDNENADDDDDDDDDGRTATGGEPSITTKDEDNNGDVEMQSSSCPRRYRRRSSSMDDHHNDRSANRMKTKKSVEHEPNDNDNHNNRTRQQPNNAPDYVRGETPPPPHTTTTAATANKTASSSPPVPMRRPRRRPLLVLEPIDLADIWIEAADDYASSFCAHKQKQISKLQAEVQTAFLTASGTILYGLHRRLMQTEAVLYSDSFQPVPSVVVLPHNNNNAVGGGGGPQLGLTTGEEWFAVPPAAASSSAAAAGAHDASKMMTFTVGESSAHRRTKSSGQVVAFSAAATPQRGGGGDGSLIASLVGSPTAATGPTFLGASLSSSSRPLGESVADDNNGPQQQQQQQQHLSSLFARSVNSATAGSHNNNSNNNSQNLLSLVFPSTTAMTVEELYATVIPKPLSAPRLLNGHSSAKVSDVFDSLSERMGTLRALLLEK